MKIKELEKKAIKQHSEEMQQKILDLLKRRRKEIDNLNRTLTSLIKAYDKLIEMDVEDLYDKEDMEYYNGSNNE